MGDELGSGAAPAVNLPPPAGLVFVVILADRLDRPTPLASPCFHTRSPDSAEVRCSVQLSYGRSPTRVTSRLKTSREAGRFIPPQPLAGPRAGRHNHSLQSGVCLGQPPATAGLPGFFHDRQAFAV